MSAKKKTSLTDSIRDAAIGYTVIVLGITCFLIVLAVLMAGVRVVVGTNTTANVTAATTETAPNTGGGRTA